MKRDNHYEAAFEAFLRGRGVAVVPIDEARRSYLDADEVKSPDFIVVGPDDAKLVVDVKGRKFPGGPTGKRRTWENWCEQDDVTGLTLWAARFGPAFRGVLAFTYQVMPSVFLPPETPDLFAFRDRLYLMRAVDVADYREFMRPRSPRWSTVHLHADDFRRLVRPFSHFLTGINHRVTVNTEEANTERRTEFKPSVIASE